MRASVVLAIGFMVATSFVAVPAAAAPGTCECFSGICVATPGGCVKTTGCSLGYQAACQIGSRDSGVCPVPGQVTCLGTCGCMPIAGFCESVGGAEFCDAGVDTGAPDTTVVDTAVPDTSVADSAKPDTSVSTDTGVTDTAKPDTAVGDSAPVDTAVPDTAVPDTAVPDVTPVDTGVPGDGGVDTGTPGDGGDTGAPLDAADGCVPLSCPMGTSTVAIPGECNPYCAQPCGTSEFKCSALPGTECRDGFCIPKCLITPCPVCKRCRVGEGVCGDDMTCDAGPDATPEDTATEDATIDFDTGTDDATTPDAGDPFGNADQDTLGTQGGCGCDVPGSGTSDALAMLAGAAAIAALARRRRNPN